MKITALEESTDFATLDTEKLFSKLKSHELSRKGSPNHDASLTSKDFITSTRVGGHVAPQTLLTHLLWSLLYLPYVQLLMSSTRASPTTRSPCWQGSSARCTYSARRGGGLLGAVSSVVTPPTSSPTAPRGRSSTPPTSTTTTIGTTQATRARVRRSTTSGTRRRRSSRSDDSSSKEDERPKRKMGDFTGLCLMGKSSHHISDSDVSDDSSPEGLSLRVVKHENALCNQDKLLGKVFRENKKLNLELESSFSEIASL
jgi:hypothetical protein